MKSTYVSRFSPACLSRSKIMRKLPTQQGEDPLFRALGRAAPNTHARTEIGVFVSYVEPLANPFLAARFIIVHCQINPLAIAEGLRVAFGLIEKATNHRRLTDESIGRRRTSAHPAAAVLHRSLEGIFVMTAEPERQMRLLDRFWFHRNIFEIPKRPVKTRLRFTPEKFHHLHRFGEAGDAAFARITKDRLVRAQMATAKPNTHDRPTSTHTIQRRICLGELDRITQREKND